MKIKRSGVVHGLFLLGVIAKGIDGVLEIVGGVLLLWVSPDRVESLVRLLTQHELSQDPHDLIAGYLLHASQGLTSGTIQFGALYLLSHGLVKVVLVVGLLLRRYWAYPAAILIFLFFLIYQLYRWTHTHAPELILLSVIDVFVILLTWAEYRRLQGTHGFRGS
jgi:uncharacterized membrane protein